MPVVEIELDDDEELIRVFTRFPNQTWGFKRLSPKDFARIMKSHSGISLWRLRYISREEAMARLETPKLKGTAICKAKALKALGLRFFGSNPTDAHVSTRCPGCNSNVNYGAELCQTGDGSPCSLDLESPVSLTKTLADRRIFTVDRAITIVGQ